MRKYTASENVEVLSPAQHQAVGDSLQKMGKQSAAELSEEERKALSEASRRDS